MPNSQDIQQTTYQIVKRVVCDGVTVTEPTDKRIFTDKAQAQQHYRHMVKTLPQAHLSVLINHYMAW